MLRGVLRISWLGKDMIRVRNEEVFCDSVSLGFETFYFFLSLVATPGAETIEVSDNIHRDAEQVQ